MWKLMQIILERDAITSNTKFIFFIFQNEKNEIRKIRIDPNNSVLEYVSEVNLLNIVGVLESNFGDITKIRINKNQDKMSLTFRISSFLGLGVVGNQTCKMFDFIASPSSVIQDFKDTFYLLMEDINITPQNYGLN